MLGEPELFVAEPHARALISSLLRELPGWVEVEACGRLRLELALTNATIEVPLQRPSGVGRVASGQPRLRDAAGVRA
ncbi:MAG TPA: hypothetical protein VGB85_04250, partial [Nannocystis sp.]